MTSDASGPSAAFLAYTRTFQRLDPKAVAQHFHVPALLTTPDGVFAVADEAAVEQGYRPVMSRLRGAGYGRSTFPELREQRLSDQLAIVSGTCIWEREDGSVMQRFGIHYTLRRVGPSWKILSALVYVS